MQDRSSHFSEGGIPRLPRPSTSAWRNTAHAWTDGPPPATFTVYHIERAVRCGTVKVSAESAGAVASNVFLRSLTIPDKVADSHNLMVVLAHLQGVAATFRVGRHHPSWTTL